MKKLTILVCAFACMVMIVACGGGNEKREVGNAFEMNWAYYTFDDSKEKADGGPGNSAITISDIDDGFDADITLGNSSYLYHFSGVSCQPAGRNPYPADHWAFEMTEEEKAEALEEDLYEDGWAALRDAVAVSFWISGDGHNIQVQIPTWDIDGPTVGGTGDSAYYGTIVPTSEEPTEYTFNIPSDFAQPSGWGQKKSFDQRKLTGIQFQTSDQTKGEAVKFQVWGLTVYAEAE